MNLLIFLWNKLMFSIPITWKAMRGIGDGSTSFFWNLVVYTDLDFLIRLVSPPECAFHVCL